MTKKRILIKLSGASLKENNSSSIFNIEQLKKISLQIKELSKNNLIGIVVGGGNIWRGAMDKDKFLTNEGANNIGMLATVMNGIAISDAIKKHGIKTKLYSSFNVEKICSNSCNDEINEFIDNGGIAIFVGGTGYPYFTTDTCSALRALDMKAKTIFMAKNGVDGVYSDDPLKNKNAKFFNSLTFREMIDKNIKIMDLTSATLCESNGLEIVVFNMGNDNSIVNASNGKKTFTKIIK